MELDVGPLAILQEQQEAPSDDDYAQSSVIIGDI